MKATAMKQLSGTITALITPFLGQELDEEGLAYHIERQIALGIDGILVLGTTGETPTLSEYEQERIITIAVREGRNRIPILVGTGTNCTRQTIAKTKKAKDLGADGVVVVTPYYNKPTQEGIFRHFEAIVNAVEIPLMLYNIPGRTGVNIETATLLRIAALPNVIGVKEASGSVSQAGDVIHTITERFPHFSLFSGDDALTLPMISLGARGVISVVSNLVPDLVSELVQAALSGNLFLAKKLHHALLPLFKTAFIETNPAPIKEALDFCDMPAGPCRAPLAPLLAENRQTLQQLLTTMQLTGERKLKLALT